MKLEYEFSDCAHFGVPVELGARPRDLRRGVEVSGADGLLAAPDAWGLIDARATPVLETGDPRYAWVGHSVFVSEPRPPGGRVIEYRSSACSERRRAV